MSGTQPRAADAEADRFLQQAQRLVAALQQGRSEEAARLLDDLTTLREQQIYLQIVDLTRSLRESFSAFIDNAEVAAIARAEIPDARERLRHVIALTQKSADRTLTAVEACLPLAHGLGERARTLEDKWTALNERHPLPEAYRRLGVELQSLLAATRADADCLHTGLSDVLVAQEFQDLAGQLIQRVISLVNDVETQLISIIAATDSRSVESRRPDTRLNGPLVPGVKTEDVVGSQDEVDALLSGLGC